MQEESKKADSPAKKEPIDIIHDKNRKDPPPGEDRT